MDLLSLMVTKSEQQVVDKYKKKGYNAIHCGVPDFIFYKAKGEGLDNIDINSVEFTEVKYNGDKLTHEQQIWRHILKKLGLKYKLIHIIDKEKQKKQMENLTSIQVTKELKDKLNSMKKRGESYESVIISLIENENKVIEPPRNRRKLNPSKLIG